MTWTELNNRAYVPYSKTPRSCVVKGSKGGYYAGVRIENISFPLSISAIQAGCSICLSEGETPVQIILPDKEFPQLNFWSQEFDCSVEVNNNISDIKLKNLQKHGSIDEREHLESLLKKAVVPNSGFRVSCILYTSTAHANQETATWFEGVNVEVSDWQMGLCAERVALAKAFANGGGTPKSIAIHTQQGEFSSPCGACRQVLYEHIPLEKAKLHHADGTYSEHFVLDFLPFSFTSKELGG